MTNNFKVSKRRFFAIMNDASAFICFTLFLVFFLIKTGGSLRHISHGRAEEKCGHPNGMVTGKIVGGYDVGYYKYPWFVALYKDEIPYCGGTLVTKKSVVTAAHCFQQYVNNPKGIEKEYDLKMGTYNICNTHETTLKTYEARKVYIHEKYAKEDPFFDIALIVLKEDVNFEPACLPVKAYNDNERPREAIIAGYGVLRYQDHMTSCILREARVRLYSDNDCKKMLYKAEPELDNFANAFCAGYMEGGVDGCQGDSGGPLMVLQSGSRYALLGLTSFGYKCAAKDLLGVYTDVSKFLDWINTKTNAPITDNSDSTDESDDSDYTDSPDESDENETDDNSDDEDYNDDDESRKKRFKIKKSKRHHHKKGKKSLRTKTAFEIAKINERHHNTSSKHWKRHKSTKG